MSRWYLEIGNDPSDNKELYKRYSSTEPFKAMGQSRVVELIDYKDYDFILTQLGLALDVLNREAEHSIDGNTAYSCREAVREIKKKLKEKQ